MTLPLDIWAAPLPPVCFLSGHGWLVVVALTDRDHHRCPCQMCRPWENRNWGTNSAVLRPFFTTRQIIAKISIEMFRTISQQSRGTAHYNLSQLAAVALANPLVGRSKVPLRRMKVPHSTRTISIGGRNMRDDARFSPNTLFGNLNLKCIRKRFGKSRI